MPRPKVNIYCFFENSVLMFKSVKADYNREYDCYFVDAVDMGKRSNVRLLITNFLYLTCILRNMGRLTDALIYTLINRRIRLVLNLYLKTETSIFNFITRKTPQIYLVK